MNVRVEKAGNRILLASDRPTPGLKQVIPGAYFRKDATWSLPLDLETCSLLRDRFASRLTIGPNLWAWAKAEKASRTQQAVTASAADADLRVLPTVAPILAAAMSSRTYQRSGVRFVADTKGRDGRRRALIGDTVGLGKTAEALGAILESEAVGPFLVICPMTAVNTAWTSEIRRWLPRDEVITIPENGYTRDKIHTTARQARDNILNSLLTRAHTSSDDSLARTWVVIHPAVIRTRSVWICALCSSQTRYKAGIVTELDCTHDKDGTTKVLHDHTFPQLFQMDWGAVVVDESDQVLIRLTGTPNLQRRGADMLRDLVREGGLRIAMSGTPFRSKPHQIWSTLNWLDPKRWSSKWNFLGRYWELGGYSGYTVGEFIEERERMLHDELLDVMIQRTREQVRGDLPPKLYGGTLLMPDDETSPIGVWLEMTKAQAKIYKQMEQTGTASLKGGDITPVGVLAEITRLRQFAGSVGELAPDHSYVPRAEGNKYEWLVEFMRELGFPERPSGKFVVVSQWTKLLNAFALGLVNEFKGLQLGFITGEVSQAKRKWYIAEFEDPDSGLNVLFLNTKAGGSAITLDQADAMVFLDETNVDDEQEQAEGRIDNRNPEKRVVPRTYYYLRSLGTIEERIAAANAEAKRRGKRILSSKRRVELYKRALDPEGRLAFTGGPWHKIRHCAECGVARNMWHVGDCSWDGE